MNAHDPENRRRIRVLLIEDSTIDTEFIIEELRRAGFEPSCTHTDTEPDFLDALETCPDVILSDYNLPQFDGMRAVDLVRSRGLDIPVILISGTVGEDLATTAIKRGADDYLLKDRLARLGAAVSNALAMRGLRDERRKSDEAVRRSETLYRLIADNMADVIWTFDIESMRITYVSPSVERLTGRTHRDVLAGGIEEFLSPQSVTELLGKLRDALAAFEAGSHDSPRVQTNEVEHIHRDGGIVPAEMVTTILTDDQDRPVTVVGVSRNIAERRRAEAATRRNEERLQSLYDLGRRRFASEEELVAYALHEKVRITGSSFGYLHFLNEGGEISSSIWSRRAAVAPDLQRADLWIECVRGRQAVVCNRPRTAGIPRFLCVPVLDGAKLVAAVGVAGRESDYDESDALQLRLFMDQLWKLIVHRRSERSLAASEEKYRQIVETASEGIWMIDDQARTTYVNRRMAEMLGTSADEMLGRQVSSFHEDGERDAAAQSINRGREGPRETHDVRLRRRDGSYVSTLMSTSPLFDGDGKYVGRLAMVTDITALRHADEERHLLSTAIDHAAESIMITDTTGTIEYANPAFTKTTGYSLEEALGKNPRFLKSGRHPAQFYRQMWDTLARGEVWSGRIVNRRKDDSEYQEDTSISPVRDRAGRTVNYVAVKRDVTEIVALESQLHHAQKMEAVGRLAGGVAHDFNNLLQALLGQVEVLQRRARAGDERVPDVIAEIHNQVQRCTSLTRQLLLFARREVGSTERFDLSESVRGTVGMLRHLVRENVSFEVDLAPDLPIVGDRGEIEQVLTNLVVNASDAMPDGGRLTLLTSRESTLRARLCVKDSGHGIPDAIRQRIFEPFFTTKTAGQGTGLGLAVLHGIVTKHGGTIQVESDGTGTTFTITLPLADGGPATAMASSDTPTPEGDGERILLVEDEAGVRTGLQLLLSNLHYDVVAVASAEEAEQAASNGEPFDVLLTDVTLPGIPGNLLAQRLRLRWPRLHVILMTGYLDDPALSVRADPDLRLLQKPFGMDVLAREIHSLLK